jgi:hypothetical protein
MTGVILDIMRRHFQDGNIVDPDAKGKVWTDTNDTGIFIEPVTKFAGIAGQNVQQRPAILVKRNSFKPLKLSIGDRYHGTGVATTAQPGVEYVVDSSERFGVLMTGSHTLFCIGKSGAEAEVIGTEAFFELVEFKQLIRKDIGLTKFEIMDMSEPKLLEESKEHWVTVIPVTYAFRHDWKLRSEGMVFKTIQLETGG